MKKIILILCLFPALVFAGTPFFAPNFKVGNLTARNIFGVDSLAARGMSLSGGLSVAGALAAGGKLVVSDSLRVEETAIIKGATTISGLAYPNADGSAGYSLVTDGNGTLSWANLVSGSSALWTRNVGSGYCYPTTSTDNISIGSTSNSGYPLYLYQQNWAYDSNPILYLRSSNSYGLNHIATSNYGHFYSRCRGWSGSSGNEYHVGIGIGGTNKVVTGSADSIYVENAAVDFAGFDVNKYYGFRFLKADVPGGTTLSLVTTVARIAWDNHFFYVGDATTGDKDWRCYVGDDGAYSDYFGWDDGLSKFYSSNGWIFTGSTGVNDESLAGTYDLEIGDSLYTGGNITVGGKVYVTGSVSAESFTDRCEVYEENAIEALAGIAKKTGSTKNRGFSQLDHKTLPGGVYVASTKTYWQNKETHARQPFGWTPPDSVAAEYEQVEYTEEGRDLGRLVSVLVKAVQEQKAINEALISRIEKLEK